MEREKILEKVKERWDLGKEKDLENSWEEISNKISDAMIETIAYIEETGGEPRVLFFHNRWMVVDGAKETPKGRVSLCYDEEARLNRKKNTPSSSAEKEAKEHNLSLLSEEMYFSLQKLFLMDEKISSWLFTEKEVREKGGAIFGDRRFGRVFVYHNGADSYYGSRGFRGYFFL
ncbi:DUF4256 domain-containing protein [Peptoniphilus sp. KCTC 25270]|uniref:DUF4256 domain-containing protein n=1 Tax=Peptoniphilus sp. KCTC 25270 TaxID=2897414 RepID=UPI001E6545EE|nr:DUF4256 domain-containing protein [Peptoniphilus sp. KCTC 25270]MCD1146649.1 DUF4256 domain-containing protein [Peptoniphilus sp. KCTC 25270]